MSQKEISLKEKFKQALESTARVISDDFKPKLKENKSSDKFNFLNLENLSNKNNFIKARAEADSVML